jgi:hypothetical protein
MRDLDALLCSLVNVDRNSLIAILSSEAEAVARLVKSMPRRTRSQNARRCEAIDRATRINRILCLSGMARQTRICPRLTDLTNLGQGPGGITASELTEKVVSEITNAVARHVGNVITKGGFPHEGKAAIDTVEKVTKRVTELFKRFEQ